MNMEIGKEIKSYPPHTVLAEDGKDMSEIPPDVSLQYF